MINIKKGLYTLVFVAAGMISFAANAEQKIAVVDVQRILQALPQIATIEQTINDEFRDQRQALQKLQADGNFMVQKLQRESATLSEDEKKDLEQQIQKLSQELQEKGQPLQQEIQRRSTEERNKLFGLISQAINNIAEDKGYDLVLNATAVPFAKPQHDISQEVLDLASKVKP